MIGQTGSTAQLLQWHRELYADQRQRVVLAYGSRGHSNGDLDIADSKTVAWSSITRPSATYRGRSQTSPAATPARILANLVLARSTVRRSGLHDHTMQQEP